MVMLGRIAKNKVANLQIVYVKNVCCVYDGSSSAKAYPQGIFALFSLAKLVCALERTA